MTQEGGFGLKQRKTGSNLVEIKVTKIETFDKRKKINRNMVERKVDFDFLKRVRLKVYISLLVGKVTLYWSSRC